ncbi:MAG: hypothetical protein Q3999_03255 [Buchananella hordeovulneris]|nr:hypothetical protein [Buchananella hordeovulneris]
MGTNFPHPAPGAQPPAGAKPSFDFAAAFADAKMRWALLAGIAAIVAIIGTVMPWAKLEVFGVSESVLGVQGEGKLSLILAAGALGSVIGMIFQPEKVDKWAPYVIAAGNGLAALVALYTNFSLKGDDVLDIVTVGLGLWLTVIAGLAGAVFGVLFLVTKPANAPAAAPMGAAYPQPGAPVAPQAPQGYGFPPAGGPAQGGVAPGQPQPPQAPQGYGFPPAGGPAAPQG